VVGNGVRLVIVAVVMAIVERGRLRWSHQDPRWCVVELAEEVKRLVDAPGGQYRNQNGADSQAKRAWARVEAVFSRLTSAARHV
jgi:hypothetical protein